MKEEAHQEQNQKWLIGSSSTENQQCLFWAMQFNQVPLWLRQLELGFPWPELESCLGEPGRVSHSPPLWRPFLECCVVGMCSSQSRIPTPAHTPHTDWLGHLVLDILHHSAEETPGGSKSVHVFDSHITWLAQWRETRKFTNPALRKNYFFPTLFYFLYVSYWQSIRESKWLHD